jgi:hypothetical protein
MDEELHVLREWGQRDLTSGKKTNCSLLCRPSFIGNFEIRTILQLAASIKDKIKKLHVLCTG